ncbi:MAG: tetratricopeptide repeat protein [Armatimonadetes bacterium]|nr:tetratricopeptide repeat protein [Armatimonadota bacterium]
MLCPRCEFDNPEAMVYCGRCGEQLDAHHASVSHSRCQRCGFENPPSFLFCGACGSPLEESPTFPLQPADVHVEPPPQPPSERRRVTILFADVMGFTAMSEKLDPEEVFRLMNRCFSELGKVIARHEGTIDKFIGDCVMALFGAPIAHENDPERAVRAALEMQVALSEFAARLREQTGTNLQMRVGLNSGLVVAGVVGSEQKQQYTVMGDAVNLASRIETTARPNSVLVSETVYRQTLRLFQYQAWEPIRVKGKEQPVSVYEVTGEKPAAGAFGYGGDRSTFVGRDAELQIMRDALSRSTDATRAVMSVVGQSGIGKSRLLEEFAKIIHNHGLVCLRSGCPFGESRNAYRTWRILLSQLCGIKEGDDHSQQKAAISETLAEIEPGLQESLPYLADVFGLPRPEGTDAQAAKRATQHAVRTVMSALARKRGLVVIVDDVQWMEPLSLEIMDTLTADLDSERFLLVTAYRPEFTPSWAAREGSITLNLKGLSDTECEKMAAALLGAEPQSLPILRSLIVERAAGFPLFVEELVRSLVDTGWLVSEDGQWKETHDPHHVQLPETLEAIVTARIDLLRPPVKHALQCAAVIGKSFPVEVLRAVAGLHVDFAPSVAQLETAEFIEELTPQPSWEYGFRQSIIQDVAYQMLLIELRHQYHEAVASTIEALSGARLEDQYEKLAYHYSRSDNVVKAVDSLILSGAKALRLFATSNARSFFTEALETLDRLPVEARAERRRDAHRCYEALGDVATLTGEYVEARSRYHQVLDELSLTCKGSLDGSLRVHIAALKRKIGDVYMRESEAAEALRWLRDGLAEVEEGRSAGAQGEVAKIWSELAGVSFRLGDYTEAADQASRGLAQAERVNSPKEISDCCLVLGVVQHSSGDYDSAGDLLRRSLTIREELGDLVGIASALNNLGNLSSDGGRYQEADEFFRRSVEMRERMGHTEGMSAGLVNRGNVACNLGRFREAEAHYRQALALAHRIGNNYTATFALVNLGRVQLARGEVAEARETLNTAAIESGRLGLQDLLSLTHASLSSVDLLAGNPEGAETNAVVALEIANPMGSKFHQAIALRSHGAALAAMGRREPSVLDLQESLRLFEDMNAELEVGRTCEDLARAMQDEADALNYRNRAREIFERLHAEGDLERLSRAC